MSIRPVFSGTLTTQQLSTNRREHEADAQPEAAVRFTGTRWPRYMLLALGLATSGCALNQGIVHDNPPTSTINRSMSDSDRIRALEEKVRQLQAQIDEFRDDHVEIPLNNIIPPLVERIGPAHVSIQTYYDGGTSWGSGIWIVDENGKPYILTNHHVIDSAYDENKGFTAQIRLYNGSDLDSRVYTRARLVQLPDGKRAASEKDDLALLEITDRNFRLPANVVPARFRNLATDPIQAGELVLNVGSPYFQADAIMLGVVSNAERILRRSDPNVYIQTDTQVSPGMSGGGLFDMQGRLIGVTRAKMPDAGNIGYIIRLDSVLKKLDDWGFKSE